MINMWLTSGTGGLNREQINKLKQTGVGEV